MAAMARIELKSYWRCRPAEGDRIFWEVSEQLAADMRRQVKFDYLEIICLVSLTYIYLTCRLKKKNPCERPKNIRQTLSTNEMLLEDLYW